MKNMLIDKYFCLVLILIGVGILLDIYAGTFSIVTKITTIYDSNGERKDLTVIDYPHFQKAILYFAKFIYSLAGSIFISLFVTNRISELQKDKQEQELKALKESININVFESLFKTLIPVEIFNVIKSEIIESKVIRKDALWLLDFKEINGKIELKQSIIYYLENISLSEVINPINAILDPSGNNKSNLESIVAKIDDVVISEYNKNNNEINNEEILSPDSDGITKFTINLRIPQKKSAYIAIVTRTIFDSTISDQYFTKYSLINAQLIANFPSNYKFKLYASMSTPLQLTESSQDKARYVLKGAILPHQGFIYDLTLAN